MKSKKKPKKIQNSKVKSQRSKVKSQKSKVKSEKSKVKSQKSKVKSQKSKAKSQKSKARAVSGGGHRAMAPPPPQSAKISKQIWPHFGQHPVPRQYAAPKIKNRGIVHGQK